jgi:prolyl-tRNA synthetase
MQLLILRFTVHWCDRCDTVEAEEDVRKRSATADAMGAKTLCIPLEQPELPAGTACFITGKEAKNWALWGRSY